jgi:hypothetical protein
MLTGPSKYEVFAMTEMRGGPGNVGGPMEVFAHLIGAKA